ncbi:MAG TPA: MBL fold metallo-hydrolase [Bryobacteraceae bacterium]|nr:MBL fold metallo-hydrolase [Bryobacteraceae bacterium]
MEQLARDVAIIKTLMSNAYLVGNAKCWILVDALTPRHERTIKQAAEALFGFSTPPQGILLTHGHVDHVGSAAALADFWNVKVYAHRLEHPYLTGRAFYPPLDHTAPGFFSTFSRIYSPASNCNLGDRLAELDLNHPPPWLADWRCHFTPGHSPGHLVFFRPEGAVLLAGDAVTTMNLDSFFGTVMQRPQLCGPPAPATIDWRQAHSSVQQLARLRPDLICAGHGKPMFGQAHAMQKLADDFPIPAHGRYVREPAITDEEGVRYLPPAPLDLTPKLLAAAGIGAFGFALLRKRERNKT